MFKDKITNWNKTFQIVEGISDLPFDHNIADDVLYLLKDPNINFIRLAKAIQRDHGLFFKILTAANALNNNVSKKVFTIERAVSILGLENLKNIVSETIKNDSMKMDDADDWYRNIFWRHSIFVANTAKSISDGLNYRKSDYAFSCGFLHDIGVFVIRYFFTNEYFEIKALVETGEISHLKAEKIVLGSDHLEIGNLLLNKWSLPDEMTEAVTNHHSPSDSTQGIVLSSIVHLADFVTHWIGISQNYWDANIEFDENIIPALKLSDNNISEEIPFAIRDILRDILSSKGHNGKHHLHSNESIHHYS